MDYGAFINMVSIKAAAYIVRQKEWDNHRMKVPLNSASSWTNNLKQRSEIGLY